MKPLICFKCKKVVDLDKHVDTGECPEFGCGGMTYEEGDVIIHDPTKDFILEQMAKLHSLKTKKTSN